MSAPANETILDRARGCAVGAAVGDALGMSLEFSPPRPADDLLREMQPARGLPAGSFTDDTEMALALAESLLTRRPLDPDDLARRFAGWLRDGPPDVGTHTRAVLARVAQGVPWRRAVAEVQSSRAESASNGSVMRCWPVALAHWNAIEALQADSRLQSEVTHPHPDCVAACVLVNTMIYYLLQGHSFQAALEAALPAASLAPDFEALVRAAPAQPRDRLKNTGWVRHAVETAIWAVGTTGSLEDAVVQAANLGDDADTGAAVTGALAGALYGLKAVPARWRDALRGVWPIRRGRIWSADDFVQLADRLVTTEEAV